MISAFLFPRHYSDRSPDTPVPPPFRFCPYHTTEGGSNASIIRKFVRFRRYKTTAGKGQEVWAEYDAIVTEGGWASQPKQGSPDLLA